MNTTSHVRVGCVIAGQRGQRVTPGTGCLVGRRICESPVEPRVRCCLNAALHYVVRYKDVDVSEVIFEWF